MMIIAVRSQLYSCAAAVIAAAAAAVEAAPLLANGQSEGNRRSVSSAFFSAPLRNFYPKVKLVTGIQVSRQDVFITNA